jgi:hypothetical protein
MTLAAKFVHPLGPFEHSLPWVAGGLWLLYFASLSLFVRGYLAEKRGVVPADFERRDIKVERRNLLGWLLISCVMGQPIAINRTPAASDWDSFGLFIAVFFMQLSEYAYLEFQQTMASPPISPALDAPSSASR